MARTALYPHISKNNIQVPDPGPVEQSLQGELSFALERGGRQAAAYLNISGSFSRGLPCPRESNALREILLYAEEYLISVTFGG